MLDKRNLYFLFSILVAIKFWSFISAESMMWAYRLSILLFLVSTALLFFTKKNGNKGIFDSTVSWTIISIFISAIPANLYYNQGYIDSITMCMALSFGLLYFFLLKRWNYPESRIIKLLTIIFGLWVLFELGQQFTYPIVWFSSTYDDGYVPERMNLYRFYIWGIDFVMILFAYYLGQLVAEDDGNNRKKNNLLLFIVFMVGILCYCSRKHIIASLVVVVYSIFNTKGSKKTWYFLSVIALFAFLYFEFFDSYQQMSMEAQAGQGEGEDFVRYISAQYFLFDFSSAPMYPIWGAGVPAGKGALHDFVENLAEMRIYQADVGIIGYYSMTGLLGVSAILMYIYKFIKNWKYIDPWFKYFFIMKMIMIIFDFWAIWGVGMFAYAVFLYLLENNIQKNKALNYV